MELRGKVYAMAKNGAEFLCEIEIAQADAAQRPGCKLRQHIDITSFRIKILPQDRPKEREGANASLATKAGDPFAIDRDGQLSNGHRRQITIPAERGQPNSDGNLVDVSADSTRLSAL